MKKKGFIVLGVIWGLISCYNPDSYILTSADKDKIIRIFISDSIAPAEENSLTTIYAELPLDADNSLSEVTFKTNMGIFVESQTNTYSSSPNEFDLINNNKRYVKATLKSPLSTGACIISAEVQNVLVTDTILFINSIPTRIKVNSNKFVLNDTLIDEINISAVLSCDTGKVSLNNQVNFLVTDNMNNPIGFFRNLNNLSDANGLCSVIYSAGPSTYNGFLNVLAFANGSSISDTIQVYLNP